VLVAKRDIPREQPQKVSLATRFARNDLYGDRLNEALLMRPGDAAVRGMADFDDRFLDGVVDGSGVAAAGMSGTVRRVQTGYVRSYALSLFAGALLVVAALLAVNLA
jgi:NADH-quinone oxidoreductase subunit L